ncbi:MAG TPA: MlaD family protein [Sulfuriferula sp.]|nr:MlaD family protein [Sulfuriferula sp.]
MNTSIQFKTGLFLVIFSILGAAAFLYLLYARGTFESESHFTLIAADATGVGAGTPVVYRGIAVGRVSAVSLSDHGLALVAITVPEREHRWLRTTSEFTLDKPLVGATVIRLDTSSLDDPQLANGASVPLILNPPLDVPGLVAKVNGILDQLDEVSKNVAYITRKNGEIDTALVNVKTITTQMSGKYGVAQGLLGSEQNAQVLMDALNNTRKLTADLDALSQKADHWAFSPGGAADKADQSLAHIQAMLGDLRVSLKKLDAILINVNGLSANLKDGTDDLGQLRGQVDEAVSKASQLITKINRILPSSKPGEVKLP